MALNAPLAPGWARATCTGPVQASLLFRQHNSEGMPVAEAGVNAATVPATRFVTFAEQGEGQFGDRCLPMQTLPPYRSLSPLLPGTRRGEVLASVNRDTVTRRPRRARHVGAVLISPALPDRSKSPPTEPIVSPVA